jgi:ABC-type lipoprotein export system ATPase subunit
MDRLGDPERRRERARQVGLVFQEFELLDYLDALDNILVPLRVRGASRDELRAGRLRAEELAASVGIADLLGRTPSRLSQGERQRVAIARALVTDPALVLCDEPTGNLDPEAAARAVDLLIGEARARDAALLMVTHDHGLLDRFDRVVDVTALGGGPAEGAAS